MLTSVSQEFRKFSRHCYTLRMILKDTSRSLEDIQCNMALGEEFRENFQKENVIGRLQHMLEDCFPGVLVFGQSCHAKATFINYMLDQTILPLNSCDWRWVRLSYGHTKEIRLTLMHEYEILDNLQAHERPWVTVPERDLKRTEQESTADLCQALEIKLNSTFLKEKVNILVPPDYPSEYLADTLKDLIHILPVIIYVVDESLNDCHIREIRIIKEAYQDLPILFINMTKNGIEILSPSEQPILRGSHHLKNDKFNKKFILLKNQLINLGFISDNVINGGEFQFTQSFCTEYNNMLMNDYEFNEKFVIFVRHTFKSYLLNMSSKLSMIHNECLKNFILRTFDMAREIQITPQRIKYAQVTEAGLYRALMEIAGKKQEELVRIIQSTLHDMKLNAKKILEDYYCEEMVGNNAQQSFTKPASMEIQQIVLNKLGNAVASQLVQSVGCLHENFTGTLQRCLENLEKNCKDQDGNLLASDAVKKIITAAYSIELKSSSSFSIAHSFMERLRNFIHSFQLPWVAHSQQQYDFAWRLQTVTNMLDSLSSSKLAKTVSAQFQEVVRSSHEAFQSAMRSLEHQLSGKLERMEEQRIAIRKQYAPRFARLALESTSLCDLVQWGMPVQSKEIGRGQYGVVFACEPWGGIDPCAVKSVVPPDDRHWNDLAMEFYYTRTIAEHPRIVKLRGSVIDHQYGGGFSSAVLLVMERMSRDLYCGLRNGLSWIIRLQIAIDVIEGIRYLHSQGLVHRDIKLKNVLLDNDNRAKLTDFGFCIPEAMMSGSIVGTPVHMAPELLSGHYDSNVDVYAFGILFWYICANQVRLPYVFEQFLNKEQLWTSVRKGLRPECLPIFSKACWNLMERCWAADPEDRPPLGEVQPILEAIWYKATVETPSSGKVYTKNNCPSFSRNSHEFVENYEYSQNPYVYLREY